MLKQGLGLILAAAMIALPACGEITDNVADTTVTEQKNTVIVTEGETHIALSDSEITVNGEMICADTEAAVYVANDIIYYESGKDATYGEGTVSDAHSAEEANAHTVVHITQAGTYRISGNLAAGQIFVDIGEDAKKDPNAVVTLILDGVDITCTVAPAIFFYNVYECGEKNEETATAVVDTSAAGANVIIADNSVNNVNGAHVARIYKQGTTDKLHKYDAAFYSKRSLNISGGEKGNGILNIVATNEGLDSELHLTINGGNINIAAQNDGINTNEDNISVTTINGGAITINAGLGEEGDGIDSNGFIVINGGFVLTSANAKTPDGGIDADRGILVQGGTLIACGNMNGSVSPTSAQNVVTSMGMRQSLSAGSTVKLLDDDMVIAEFEVLKDFSSLIISTPLLKEGIAYTLTTETGEIPVYATRMPADMQLPGNMGGMQRPNEMGNMNPFGKVPEGLDEWLNSTEIPEDIRTWIESMRDMMRRGGMQRPQR